MKCQILFSRKIIKYISKCHQLIFLVMQSDKYLGYQFYLSLKGLSRIITDNILNVFFIFQRNKIWHFIRIVF